jgi:hypothetical protein
MQLFLLVFHFLIKHFIILCHSFNLNIFFKKHLKFGTHGQNFESLQYLKLHLSRIFACLHVWQSFLGNPSWMYLKVKHHRTMCYGHYKTTAHHHSILGTMRISPKRMHAFNYYLVYDQSPLVQMTSNPPFDHWSISDT